MINVQYLLLTVVIFMVAAQNIVEKQYNIKVQNGNAILFAGISSLVAMVFFVVSSGFKLLWNVALSGTLLPFRWLMHLQT